MNNNNKEWKLYYEMEIRKFTLIDTLLDWVYWAREEIELLKIQMIISFKNETLDYMMSLEDNIKNTLKLVHKNLYV